MLESHDSPNYQKTFAGSKATSPQFIEQSARLIARVNKTGRNLAKTLGVSEKLAEENRQRFLDWKPDPSDEESYMTAWLYRGETYAGLSVESLDDEALEFAQSHLKIVSGLYGLLRPQDLIMPYRLEMSTRLKIGAKKNLYEFWGSTLTDAIVAQQPSFILNCASNEYSKAILTHTPEDVTVITPTFLHGGKSKMTFSKYMRGSMVRWVIEHKVTNPIDILDFDAEGYTLDKTLSKPNHPVFIAPKDFSLKGRWTKT